MRGAADALPAPGIVMGFVGAGRYAVCRHLGAYKGIAGAYRRLFTRWLPQSGETIDERPCLEINRNTPDDTSPEHRVTDLCVPLRDTLPG